MSNPLLVGVDVHRKTNVVCFMKRDGQEIGQRFSVQNNRQGTANLAQAIDSLATEEGCDAIQIAAEATGWYWWHFFQTLDQDPFLSQRPLALYSFNPRITANFKKTYSDLDKTDSIDAAVPDLRPLSSRIAYAWAAISPIPSLTTSPIWWLAC